MRGKVLALSLGLIASLGVAAQAQTQDPVGPGPGITNPTLVREQKPKYTSDALRARIQGIVEVEAVVLPDGTVGDVRVWKSLDKTLGLDAEAVAAARLFLFRPALKDGKPIPFKVIIQLEFRAPPGSQDDEFTKGAEREGTPGLVMPKTKQVPTPKYTAEAMRAKIQGIVEVEVIVGADGTVVRARVKTSLDDKLGLDEEAVAAAKRATFEPGRLNGFPVPVLVTIKLEFRLH